MNQQVEEAVEVVVLEGVNVGVDPNEAAEIVRACCRVPEKGELLSKWGMMSLTVEARKLTARVRLMRVRANMQFFKDDETPSGLVIAEITDWLRARAAMGCAVHRQSTSYTSSLDEAPEVLDEGGSMDLQKGYEEMQAALVDKMVEVGDLTAQLTEAKQRVDQLEKALAGAPTEGEVSLPSETPF